MVFVLPDLVIEPTAARELNMLEWILLFLDNPVMECLSVISFKTRGSSIFIFPLFCPSAGVLMITLFPPSYLISMLLYGVLLFRERLISPRYSLSYKIYTLWFSGRNWQAIQKLYKLKEFPLIRMEIYSNKGSSPKFQQSYQVREHLPEDGRRVRWSKL